MIKANLLLKPKDFKPSHKDWEVTGVLNPGAIRLPNKKILLMVRVAESSSQFEEKELCPEIITKKHYQKIKKTSLKGTIQDSQKNKIYFHYSPCTLPNISHFRKIILSPSGTKVESISQVQDFSPRPNTSEYGVEDPRITKIKDKYLMSYVSISNINGVYSTLAISKDLKKWRRKGIIFQEQNKDVVIFPEKIKGNYVALNRPESAIALSKSDIWISYSPDLTYWGKEKNIIRTRENSWEEIRNGAGCPPLKTKKAWLLIYHGVTNKGDKLIYSAGAALLDLKNPEKILARSPSNKPLFEPANIYEKKGFMNNVVFPTGLVPSLDKKSVLIYSGGADSIITVREISLNEILKSMEYL